MPYIPNLVIVWPVCDSSFKSFLINLFVFTNLFCCSALNIISFSRSLSQWGGRCWTQCSRCNCLPAMLTVAITSLPHAVMFLHREYKIVLAFSLCIYTSHCKLMSNILLGHTIKNFYIIVYQVSVFKLDFTCLFSLNTWANEPSHTYTVHFHCLTHAELKFPPVLLSFAKRQRSKFWGHQEDVTSIQDILPFFWVCKYVD